jgi:cytochrome P450
METDSLLAKKTRYHFPPGNSRWQSLIASFSFLKNPIQAISENMARYNGTYSGFLLGIGKFIITEDPDFIQYILKDNHTNFQKSALSTKTAARLFGRGLLFSNGSPWLKQRRLIQPAFFHSKIQGFYEIIAATVKDFIEEFPTGEKIEIYPLMRKLSFTILIHSIFDLELTDITISELSESFTEMQDYLLKDINEPLRKIFYPLNRADRMILQKSNRIRKILKAIIDQRKSEGTPHNDLLDMLLNSTYEDSGAGMDEEQMIDEILGLLFAGHETTANTLSWILYLISRSPLVAGKLKSFIGKINIFESPQNEYINAVILEGMRLYPAAWMTERVVLQDDRFNEFDIPRGTIMIPFFYGLHRNKNLWKDATGFNPDRFITNNTLVKKTKNFFPFGAGPRMCIGNNMAMVEMSFILHELLSKFEIAPTDENPDMWALITLRPRNLHLGIKRTEQNDPS